jgi:hypothetical protein
MAGQSPFFLTGANAKVKLDGKTIAFATDFSYSVQIEHATPQLLGMYEVANVEPMLYKVTGSMTVIRYAKNMKEFVEKDNRVAPDGVSKKGNGIGALEPGGVSGVLKSTVGVSMNSGQAYHSLDPSKLQNAMKFDVELYQKAQRSDGTQESQAFARLRDCRIVRVDGGVTKRGMAIEKIQFQAIYLDQDSFQAAMSGLGQQFM